MRLVEKGTEETQAGEDGEQTGSCEREEVPSSAAGNGGNEEATAENGDGDAAGEGGHAGESRNDEVLLLTLRVHICLPCLLVLLSLKL